MYVLIYTILIFIGIYLWRKYNDSEYFWLLFPFGGLLLLDILGYLLNFFQFSDNQQLIVFYVTFSLRIIALFTILLIVLKYQFNKKNDDME
jgi:hypothetical protein